ncbi:MAG TPA: VOC family protein [Nocardioides sp.]|nr:VOC family protein [Nocardioides sp.]
MTWLHAVIDVPEARHGTAAAFWAEALGWPLGAPWSGHPELRSFEPPQGRPYVHLQQIDGPPRVHVDLESHDVDAAVWLAEELGARVLAAHERWRTLASPGGLPFCVVPADDLDPPGPVTWPDGHSSRLVQVCIDSPVVTHDREVAFWQALLPGRWVDSPAPEFAGKWHDDAGSPVQLLFQRLDEPDGSVRAHLDLGTDNLPAEVTRLLAGGAEDVHPGRGWHAMRDPAGLLFCATENSPAATERRDIG